jgi:hypothetical protein
VKLTSRPSTQAISSGYDRCAADWATVQTIGRWRAVAKDGYELPKAQATERTANVQMGPGETADFELRPMRPGEYAEPSTGMFA